MTGNELFLLFWGCGLAVLALWMSFWTVYWKHKYTELHEAQRQYLEAHERARTPWPPIKS